MAGAAIGVRRLQGQSRAPSAGRISKNFAPSAAPLLSRFACFEVLRHKFNKPWWEWPERMAAAGRGQMRRACARARTAPRSNSSNSCNGSPTGNCGPASDLAAQARHEGRALSRCRRRRAIRRLRCLERAGRDFAPSRRRRAAGSAEHRRARTGALPASTPPVSKSRRSSRFARCCGPRCAMPARSGSITCWA